MCDDITDIVAIDGPAGAGKSSVARRVAEALGYRFLDTGAMYRAATWWAAHQGIDLNDGKALVESTRAMELDLDDTGDGQRVVVNGHDATAAIRTPEVTRLIYKLDQNPGVRRILVDLQRAFGAQGPAVAEGRDIGTVVFPKAKCKIFLEASLDVRTERRAKQLEAQGQAVDLAALRAEIHDRDEKSRNRAESPLRKAADAVLLDTSDMTVDEVVGAIVRLARARS